MTPCGVPAYGEVVINREANQFVTRVLPGCVTVSLRRQHPGLVTTYLRLEMTPEEARQVGAELFKDAAHAESLAEGCNQWDLQRPNTQEIKQ